MWGIDQSLSLGQRYRSKCSFWLQTHLLLHHLWKSLAFFYLPLAREQHEVRGTMPGKSTSNFWIPQNMTTVRLLMACCWLEALTNITDCRWTHVLCIICVVYWILKISWRKEEAIEKIIKQRKYICSTVLYLWIKTHL